jgi:APA family basic amino acid/polyamine antiporter
MPDADRPYKAFGYPFLPALYIVMGIAFCALLILYKQEFVWVGLGIMLSGVPIYYLWRASEKKVGV